METKKDSNFSWILLVYVTLIFSWIMYTLKRHDLYHHDIEHRIIVIERSLSETDEAVVKALQGSNEALYELKLMK